MESMSDWSSLAGDILEQISTRLATTDFMAFREVCTHWRAVVIAMEADKPKKIRRIPVLILSELNGKRELYDLSERRICAKVVLPEAKGKRCLDVGFGWILTIAYPCGDVSMFKPLSEQKTIHLPSIKSFLKDYDNDIKQAVLSDDPSSNKFVLAMILKCSTSFYYWWKGDENNWRALKWPDPRDRCTFISICNSYINKTIHTIDYGGRIFIWINIPFGKTGREQLLAVPNVKNIPRTWKYLVESTSGDLLLISRHDKSRSFNVARIDVAKRECKGVNDLLGDAIFLGENSPVAVAATDYPGVLKPNCIYFANDFVSFPNPRRKDMEIYNVQDGSLEALDFGCSYSFACFPQGKKERSPLWISPSF